jgi:hypothetical protein
MRLKTPFAHTDLSRMVRKLRDKVVVDKGVPERLETMAGLHEEPRALRGIPPVEIRIRAHVYRF